MAPILLPIPKTTNRSPTPVVTYQMMRIIVSWCGNWGVGLGGQTKLCRHDKICRSVPMLVLELGQSHWSLEVGRLWEPRSQEFEPESWLLFVHIIPHLVAEFCFFQLNFLVFSSHNSKLLLIIMGRWLMRAKIEPESWAHFYHFSVFHGVLVSINISATFSSHNCTLFHHHLYSKLLHVCQGT